MARDDIKNQIIAEAAKISGGDPNFTNLASNIGKQESSYNPTAVSPAGAIGTMQLMPQTAASLGVDPNDPTQNIQGGVKYAYNLYNQYGGNPTLTAAAYNAGPGAVAKYGGVPPYAETQNYVQQVAPGVQSQQPYMPPPDTNSLAGAYRKPNLLNILSGLAQVGGGMATSIIQARKKMPITGDSLVNSGQSLLNQQSQVQEQYNRAKNVLQYINDPKLDPNDRSLAAAYLKAGQPEQALNILNKSLGEAAYMNRYGAMVQKSASIAQNAQDIKDQAYQKQSGEYYDLNLKKSLGLPFTPEEAKLYSARDMQFKSVLDPNSNPRFQKDRDEISKGLGNVDMLNTVADNFTQQAMKLSGGRAKGIALDLKQLVASSPDLLQMQLDGASLLSLIPRSMLGEKGRIPVQIEERFNRLTKGEKLYPDEIQSIGKWIKGVTDTQAKSLIGTYSALGGATPATLKEFLNNRKSTQNAFVNEYQKNATPQAASQAPANTIPPLPGENWDQYKTRTGQK